MKDKGRGGGRAEGDRASGTTFPSHAIAFERESQSLEGNSCRLADIMSCVKCTPCWMFLRQGVVNHLQ